MPTWSADPTVPAAIPDVRQQMWSQPSTLFTMSDTPFQRPGDHAATGPQPGPSDSPMNNLGTTPAAPRLGSRTPVARGRGTGALVFSGIVGLLVGGIGVGALSTVFFAEPEPFPVTLELFPEYILGLQREDMAAREAGASEAIRQYEKDFEDQVHRFHFVHAGEGASVHYGQAFALTVVNGRQSLPLPLDDMGASGSGSPTIISLETAILACVFQPAVGSAVLDAPADLTASGITDCVLNDTQRNLSLRITSRVQGDATGTATEYAGVLERTHAGIID